MNILCYTGKEIMDNQKMGQDRGLSLKVKKKKKTYFTYVENLF
jgi:hypothetical protein